jgi:hypothetical protein
MKLRRIAIIALPATLALGAFGAALPAHGAVPAPVVVNKACSKTSLANLQLQREDTGQISVDFGVDMARHTAGVAWTVKEWRNGVLFVYGAPRTIADGSFSVTRLLAPKVGVNHFVATASNPLTGETCSISASI